MNDESANSSNEQCENISHDEDLSVTIRKVYSLLVHLVQEAGALKEEVGALKKEVGALKEEVGALKEEVKGSKRGNPVLGKRNKRVQNNVFLDHQILQFTNDEIDRIVENPDELSVRDISCSNLPILNYNGLPIRTSNHEPIKDMHNVTVPQEPLNKVKNSTKEIILYYIRYILSNGVPENVQNDVAEATYSTVYTITKAFCLQYVGEDSDGIISLWEAIPVKDQLKMCLCLERSIARHADKLKLYRIENSNAVKRLIQECLKSMDRTARKNKKKARLTNKRTVSLGQNNDELFDDHFKNNNEQATNDQ